MVTEPTVKDVLLTRLSTPIPAPVAIVDRVLLLEPSVLAPLPTNTKPKLFPANAPLTVKAPVPPSMLSAANTIAPLCVAAELLLLVMAPDKEIPTPLMVNGFRSVWPLRSKTVPAFTTFAAALVLVPNAPLVILKVLPVELIPSLSVPALIVVPPLWVLAPVRIKVSVPA